jgi:hypothetical protein
MIPTTVHDPDYWLQELEPLLKELHFAFSLAVPKAHEFFTVFRKTRVNRPLLSNLIRYHALEYLWSHGYSEAREESVDDWGLRGLPNNGIELLYKRSCIRVRKGVDPPYPTTESSEDFYQQKLIEEIDAGIDINLLVLYNLDADLKYDGKLSLLRPTTLNRRTKKVRWEWRKTIMPESVNLTQAIASEYMHGGDLPLDESASDTDSNPKTGTDTL